MYIRTKDDNIYDLGNKGVSSWEYIDNDTAINKYGVKGAFYTIYYFDENKGHYSEYDNKGGRSCDFIDEKDILKQSENLKELCDCFVTESPSVELKYRFNIYKTLNGAKKCAYANGDEINIYGHIWNGITLTPVAKMNENGKLELL